MACQQTAYELPEEVTFANLVAIRDAGKQYIDSVVAEGSVPEAEAAEFDLAGLTDGSSAVVALLIAWFRYGHAHGKVVRFINVPAATMNIIEVSELAEVLPVEGASGEAA